MKKNNFLLLLISVLFLVTSCSKDDETTNPDEQNIETILQQNTVVSNTQQTEIGLNSINGNLIVINSNFPSFSEISNGYVLVGDESTQSKFGFAVKVLSVVNNGSTKTLVTEPATMLDIFKQADFTSEMSYINVNDTLHLRSNSAETYFEFALDKVLYDYDGNSATENDQIKIGGTAKFRVSKPEFQWRKLENQNSVQKTKLLIEIEDLSEVEVRVGAQAEEKWLWPGMTYTIPIKFYVPTPIGIAIPVFLPTTVNVGSSGKIEVNLGLNADFKSNGTIKVGFEYSNDNWTNLSSATFNPTFVNSGNYFGANGSIAFYPLDIDAKVNPYYQEVIEAELGAKIGLKNTVSINSQNITNKIDAVASVYGGINGDFKKWLGVNAELSFTNEIFNYNLLDQSLPNTIPTNGLVAYYPFNGNANDESGNGNNGTVNGATLTADRHGNANKAYSFDGIDDLIRVENSNSLQNFGNYSTISAWVFANNYSVTVSEIIPILAKSASNNSPNQFRLGYDKGVNQLYSSFNGAGYGASCPTILLNSWYHIVFVRNGNQSCFFINGVKYIISGTGNSTFDSSQPLIIGQDIEGLNEILNGKVDDIRIYNNALTDSEVQTLFNE